MDGRRQRALVLGLGVSGEAAARLLLGEGAWVTVVDAAADGALPARAATLRRLGAEVRLGAADLPAGSWDLAVTSPGVPAESPWLRTLRRDGVDVWPEFELGWARRRRPTLAVTGTNGKSTVVKWMAETLTRAGQPAVAAGNFGLPVAAVAADAARWDWLVLEVSSFQLEAARAFRAEAGVVLNVQPNHLDRHGTFEAYEAAKARLFAHAQPGDFAVTTIELQARWRGRTGGAATWRTFGAEPNADYRFDGGRVRRGAAVAADLRGTYFDNEILGPNAAAAVAALEPCGVARDVLESAARAFAPLPHRMQVVGEGRGVRFIDDSKATTLTALAAGLRMAPGRARLIAGGRLKEHGLDAVRNILAERAAAVYLVGEASEEMQAAWSTAVRCVPCGTVEAAVRQAAAGAREGECVLLSPGCASFDQFSGYAQRGQTFARAVKEWLEQQQNG